MTANYDVLVVGARVMSPPAVGQLAPPRVGAPIRGLPLEW